MATMDRHALANQIVRRMTSFGSWTSAINEFETPWGKVGYRQLMLLWVIRHNLVPEGATATAISNLFQIQPSVVTRVLAKLEAHGFIERTVDPDDGRRMNIRITDNGLALSTYISDLYDAEVLQELDRFTPDEVARMADAIDLFATLGERLLESRKALITKQGQTPA